MFIHVLFHSFFNFCLYYLFSYLHFSYCFFHFLTVILSLYIYMKYRESFYAHSLYFICSLPLISMLIFFIHSLYLFLPYILLTLSSNTIIFILWFSFVQSVLFNMFAFFISFLSFFLYFFLPRIFYALSSEIIFICYNSFLCSFVLLTCFNRFASYFHPFFLLSFFTSFCSISLSCLTAVLFLSEIKRIFLF